GLRWAMFFLGEYGNMTIVSAVATALFLGGWSGPGAAVEFWTGVFGNFWGNVVFNAIAVGWFLAKMIALLLLFIWIRATLPRLRADQLMRFAWLFLIPLTLVNIVVTGALLLIPVGMTLQLLFAGLANWILMIVVLVTFRKVTGVSPLGKLPRWLRTTRTGRGGKRASATPQQQPKLAGASGRR
nr:NADH-quinone oxidoreductase subunit H [Ktedonobacterales bacterium]